MKSLSDLVQALIDANANRARVYAIDPWSEVFRASERDKADFQVAQAKADLDRVWLTCLDNVSSLGTFR
jgi:hypothetical protein